MGHTLLLTVLLALLVGPVPARDPEVLCGGESAGVRRQGQGVQQDQSFPMEDSRWTGQVSPPQGPQTQAPRGLIQPRRPRLALRSELAGAAGRP